MNRFLLAILSLPFFMAGFIWSFVKQGWEDGVNAEVCLRKYFELLKDKNEYK